MKKKIFISIFSLVISLIVILSTSVTIIFYVNYEKREIINLQNDSSLIIEGINEDGLNYLTSLEDYNNRITLISDDGNVIFDNMIDASTLENHLYREEIQEALTNNYGESKRYSSSLLKRYFYVAYKLNDGNILRLSSEIFSVFYFILHDLWPIYIITIISIITAIILARFLSKRIVDPLNNIDLDDPLSNNQYPEIEPMLIRINNQHRQILSDKEKVEKAYKIRQEFTSNVSHELKTPLHIISGYAEIIGNGITSEEDTKLFAKKILNESNRMTSLVADIMKISELENQQTKNFEDVNLKNLILQIVDDLSLSFKDNNIKLELKLNDINIKANKDHLYSAIYNIVDNAIKYNKPNGKIIINLIINKDNKPQLSIKDTGIGISKEDQERIFERFYRVDKSRSKANGGTGLGLSIVKHTLNNMNATIQVKSQLNKGSTFIIIF